MKAKCYEKTWRYTPVAEQGENYLRKKFDAMRKAQRQAQATVRTNVTALPKVRAK